MKKFIIGRNIMKFMRFSNSINIILLILKMRIDFSKLEGQQSVQVTSRNGASSVSKHSNNSIPRFSSGQFDNGLTQSSKSINFNVKSNRSNDFVTFSVNYPYQVAKSLSPDRVEHQLSFLKAKKVLPTSTLKFIDREIKKDLEVESRELKSQSMLVSTSKPQAKVPKIELANIYRFNSKSIYTERKESDHKKKNSSFNFFDEIFGSKKNSQTDRILKKGSAKLTKREIEEIHEFRESSFQPTLSQTMNSFVQKKVNKKRSQKIGKKKDIFSLLYEDSKRYKAKQEISKIIEEQEKRFTMEFEKKKPRNKKYTVQGNFYERLEKSLEKQAQIRKKSVKAKEYDISTGRKMFQPITIESKLTYETLFKPTVEQISQIERQNNASRCLNEYEEGKSLEELTTTINKSVEISNAIEKQMNMSKRRRSQINEDVQNKFIEKFTIFYLEKRKNLESQEEFLIFFNKEEAKLLTIFLRKLDQFKINLKLNKNVISVLFKQFYQKLNLYDKQKLRSCKHFKVKQSGQKDSKKESDREKIKPKKRFLTTDTYHTQRIFFL